MRHVENRSRTDGLKTFEADAVFVKISNSEKKFENIEAQTSGLLEAEGNLWKVW